MTDCIDIATGWIATAAGSIDTAADWDTMAGWVDTAADWDTIAGCVNTAADWDTIAGCVDTATDWDTMVGWVDTMADDTLEDTNNGAGGVTEERRLTKCCSATDGDENCLARWVVTFVLQDLPVRLLKHTKAYTSTLPVQQ